ncbi:MAG: rhodanese-like domain-containing protein [Candidatus Electrothrix sp. AR3]|nr:rhodanese-like domain-containing protein [Candidatus Electrothrix sp. AR3]
MNKKIFFYGLLVLLLLPCFSSATDTVQQEEKSVLEKFRGEVPTDRIKTIDELHKKWKETQSGTSKAIIIDVRSTAEFAAGHIINSSNIDSHDVYTLHKKITSPDTELWITCLTQERAYYFVGLLYRYGYTNVYLAEGGIKAWAEKGYPLANKYLGKIKVIDYQKDFAEDFVYRDKNK